MKVTFSLEAEIGSEKWHTPKITVDVPEGITVGDALLSKGALAHAASQLDRGLAFRAANSSAS